jgi:hypothetical protein
VLERLHNAKVAPEQLSWVELHQGAHRASLTFERSDHKRTAMVYTSASPVFCAHSATCDAHPGHIGVEG